MKRVYAAADLVEATLISDLLRTEGIKNHVLNVNARGGLGDIPFTHAYPEVWVEQEEHFQRARRLIEAFERKNVDNSQRTCRHCGDLNPSNFASCWQCGEPMA